MAAEILKEKAMFYTILFTDSEIRTQAMLVVEYRQGDTSPAIHRHSSRRGSDYYQAYLLDSENGFQEPFYYRQDGEQGSEVEYALAVLQVHLDGTPAVGGLAAGRSNP